MISGIVVHLTCDRDLAEQVATLLRNQVGLDLGEQVGNRLPAVVSSTETQSAEDTTNQLRNLPGILHVDVVYVHLDDG